jgi:adenine-specific DNA-methyltransferase
LQGLTSNTIDFSVLPVEILGSIYERFLGNTIRFRIVKGDTYTTIVEKKPEVKKAGGVYYTPQYIVDFIIQNTVVEMIKDKTPDEIANIKICDPTCGSGSFLVGAYQYLLNYHLDYYSQSKNIVTSLKSKNIFETCHNTYKLTIDEKQRILCSSIFGVDIDNQATEVTKLSLYLKLLENESKESDDNRIKINCFDWEKDGFLDVFKNGGFDVVIGNPPYGADLMKAERDYLEIIFNV